MDVSSAYPGPSLTFGLAGEGVEHDPATGLFTLRTDRLHEGVTVTVTATDEAGAQARYVLRLTAEEVAPALVAPPALDGVARIGATVTLDPGVWSGTPRPALATEWLLDGAAVPGATGTAFVPEAAAEGRALAARVTATNAAGSAAATTPALTVTQAPPAVVAALPDRAFVLGTGPQVVEAAAAFAGAGLVFSASGPAAVDAATGRVTIATDAALDAALVTVTAGNSGGAASAAFRVSVVAEAPGEPDALGPLLYEQESGLQTVSAAALFADEEVGEGDLAFALEAAPAGVTIDAGAGLVAIPTEAAFAAARVTVVATGAAGVARRSFTVAVRGRVTAFDRPGALAELGFVAEGGAPSWTQHPDGFARLAPAAGGRAHGDWVHGRGDGRYRCLARWRAPEAAAGASAFTFAARLVRNAAGFAGLRADLVRDATGARLELRQYGGAGTAASLLAAAAADWTADEWHWVEFELDGAALRARVYPEAGPETGWTAATTTRLAPGAVGPGAISHDGKSAPVDIKRLEFHPLTVQIPARPAAPRDGDWDLEQFTERT